MTSETPILTSAPGAQEPCGIHTQPVRTKSEIPCCCWPHHPTWGTSVPQWGAEPGSLALATKNSLESNAWEGLFYSTQLSQKSKEPCAPPRLSACVAKASSGDFQTEVITPTVQSLEDRCHWLNEKLQTHWASPSPLLNHLVPGTSSFQVDQHVAVLEADCAQHPGQV